MITTRASLRYPVLSDTADVPRDVGNLANDTDGQLLVWSSTTTALRPASALNGRIHYATDGDRLSYDQGATWRQIMTVTADGKMTSDVAVNASAYQISGVALAASHLSNGVTGSGSVVLAASPTLTGSPLAPTQTAGDNTTKIATTAFVTAAIAAAAPGPGSITSTMILDGTIVNADVSATAAIVYSKLSLTGGIVNTDVNAAAAIAYSKLNLSGSIVNADVSGSAAIAYSKLNLSASIVNADISAVAAIAYSKLNLAGSIATGDLAGGAVTPAKMSVKLDSGSFTFTGGAASQAISFSTAFTSTPIVTTKSQNGQADQGTVTNVTSSGFTLTNNSGGTQQIGWHAIGT